MFMGNPLPRLGLQCSKVNEYGGLVGAVCRDVAKLKASGPIWL